MISKTDTTKIQKIAEILKKSGDILFITGAGISAESGVPTYRGIGGLYNQGTTEEGIPIEMILSSIMIAKRPELTWKYLAAMEKTCRGARFNAAHRIIADEEKRMRRVVVLTQNVDGFHRDAGSTNVIDIHGDFRKLYCMNHACSHVREAHSYDTFTIPPLCPDCGNLLRPDIVLFGEILPEAKVEKLQAEMDAGFDMIFSIGTTSVFPYIKYPVEWGSRKGIPTVEINPSTTDISDIVDFKISAKAGETLLLLEERQGFR
jgi:NAD-dependent deacetylase